MVDLQKLQVVILCGGEGLRFQNVFSKNSKVMARIGEKPILWHIMNTYSNFGIDRFVLCVKDSDEEIKHFFEGHPSNWEIQIAKTGEDTLTGGRLKKVQKLIDSDVFMLTYGDGLANVNFFDLFNYHIEHQQAATLTAVQPINQYGVLKIDENSSVYRFDEKPQMTEWVNAGYFVFNQSIFTLLNGDKALETGLLKMLAQKGGIKAYKHTGFWKSMDTFKDYQELNRLWNSEEKPWTLS